jgi:hypothetical protein
VGGTVATLCTLDHVWGFLACIRSLTPPFRTGTAVSPMFHATDVFLGRSNYDSMLGKEALHLREWMPANHRAFLQALAGVDTAAYIAHSNNPCLQGLWRSLIEAYAGERGFLGTHRYKVYGFLELACVALYFLCDAAFFAEHCPTVYCR